MNIEGQSVQLNSAQYFPSVKEMIEVQAKEQRKFSLRFSSGLLESSYQLFLLPSMKTSMIIIAGFLLIQQMLIGIESSELISDDSRILFYSLLVSCLVAFKFLNFSYLQRISWILNIYAALLMSGSLDSDTPHKEMRQLYDGMALGLCFWVQGQHIIYDGICLTICFFFIHVFKGIDGETALLSIITVITLLALKYYSYLRDRKTFMSSYLAEYWSETAIQSSFVQAILFSFENSTFHLQGTKQSSARFSQLQTNKDLNDALISMTLVNILDSSSVIQSQLTSDTQQQDFKSILISLLSNENIKKINQQERVIKGNLEHQGYQYKFTVRGVDTDFKIFMLTLGLQDPKVPAKQEKQYDILSAIFLRNYQKRFQVVEEVIRKKSISSKKTTQVMQRTMESLKYQTIALKNADKKAKLVKKTLKTQNEIIVADKEKQQINQNSQAKNDFTDENKKPQIETDQGIFDNYREEKKKSNQNDRETPEIKSQKGHNDENTKNGGQQRQQKDLDNNEIMIEINEIVKIDMDKSPEDNENKLVIQNDDLDDDKNSCNEYDDQEKQLNLLNIRELILDVQKLYAGDIESTCNISEDTRLTADSSRFKHMLFALFENCLAHNEQTKLKTNLKFTEQPFQRLVTFTMTIEACQKSPREQQEDEEYSQNQLISPERTELNLETHQSNLSNNNNNTRINRNTNLLENGLLLRYLNGINDTAVQAAEQEWLFDFLNESKCKYSQVAQSDFCQLVLQWNAEFDDTIPKEYIHEQEQEQQTYQMQQQLLKISSDSSSFYYNIQTEDEVMQQNLKVQQNQQYEQKVDENIQQIQEQEPQPSQQNQEQYFQLESNMNKNDDLNLLRESDRSSINKDEVTFQEKKENLFHFDQEIKSYLEESTSQQDNLKLKSDYLSIEEKQKAVEKINPDQDKQEQNYEANNNKNEGDQGQDNQEEEDDDNGDLQYFSSNNEEFFSETQSKGEQKEITQGIAAYNSKFKSINDCPH